MHIKILAYIVLICILIYWQNAKIIFHNAMDINSINIPIIVDHPRGVGEDDLD